MGSAPAAAAMHWWQSHCSNHPQHVEGSAPRSRPAQRAPGYRSGPLAAAAAPAASRRRGSRPHSTMQAQATAAGGPRLAAAGGTAAPPSRAALHCPRPQPMLRLAASSQQQQPLTGSSSAGAELCSMPTVCAEPMPPHLPNPSLLLILLCRPCRMQSRCAAVAAAVACSGVAAGRGAAAPCCSRGQQRVRPPGQTARHSRLAPSRCSRLPRPRRGRSA